VGLYWLQTLGCPKNQVDSDKLEGYLTARATAAPRTRGGRPRRGQHVRLHRAARQESIDTVLTWPTGAARVPAWS
jgi:hypothetical protein